MGGRHAKQKGKRGEAEARDDFKPAYPGCERVEPGGSIDRRGIDLHSTGSLRVQVKRNAKYCSVRKIEEVQCLENEIPVLWTRGDRQKAIVCLYAEDFVKILTDIGVAYDQDSNTYKRNQAEPVH